MEIPDLNTALVEAYRDLDRMIRAAKQIARCSKTAHKQAQRAIELWQVSEQRIEGLEQQLQDHQSLGLPPPSTAPHSSTPHPPVSRSIETATQTYDAAHPVSTSVEASTQTEMVQHPISTSTDKST